MEKYSEEKKRTQGSKMLYSDYIDLSILCYDMRYKQEYGKIDMATSKTNLGYCILYKNYDLENMILRERERERRKWTVWLSQIVSFD